MNMQDMTDSDLYNAAHKMQAMGGGFASALAEAFFRADSHNKQRILLAFGDMFERYAPTTKENQE